MSLPKDKCAGCRNQLPKREFLRCEKCTAAYDLDCANVSSKRFYLMETEKKAIWKCPECLSKKPKQGNIDTPVSNISLKRGGQLCDAEDDEGSISRETTQRTTGGSSTRTKETEQECSCDVLLKNTIKEMRMFYEEIKTVRTEMNNFKSEICDLTITIKAQNDRIDKLEEKIVAFEKLSQTKDDVIKNLELQVDNLKAEIQENVQEKLINDIEIANFPEVSNENTIHVTMAVAKKLGVQLEEHDIVSAERVGPIRNLTEGGPPARPRPLAVRLARRATRDSLLKAARVRRRTTTDGTGVAGPTRTFYVNERLSKFNRQLFYKTKEVAKQQKWKYVWTRNGKIHVRKEDNSERLRISAEYDIKRVFGIDNISP